MSLWMINNYQWVMEHNFILPLLLIEYLKMLHTQSWVHALTHSQCPCLTDFHNPLFWWLVSSWYTSHSYIMIYHHTLYEHRCTLSFDMITIWLGIEYVRSQDKYFLLTSVPLRAISPRTVPQVSFYRSFYLGTTPWHLLS